MKIFLFLLTVLVASNSHRMRTNWNLAASEGKSSMSPDSLPKSKFRDLSRAELGYGIPWMNVIYETVIDKGVVIQNSLPKGGSYTDPAGNNLGYRVFWTRIINETDTALEITINFPSASFDSNLKLFLPPDTMKLENILLYDYGATGIKSIIDRGLHKPTRILKTIKAKEDYFFYVGAVFKESYGAARGGFFLKGDELVYRIKGIDPKLDLLLIPSGRISTKN